MSVWREVQEALYQRFVAEWLDRTPYALGTEGFDPPDGPWIRVRIIRRRGGPGTMGAPGNRKMDRVGEIIMLMYVPPGDGDGPVADYASDAAAIFENKRIPVHDIRFSQVEPGEGFDVDSGRFWAVPVNGRFDYEELK